MVSRESGGLPKLQFLYTLGEFICRSDTGNLPLLLLLNLLGPVLGQTDA